MKKALTILMLALSLATFAQNATKVVILDTYDKGGRVRQSVLTEVKSNLAQTVSETQGFEGVVSDKVDHQLLAEGFAEHPRLSQEQTEWVASFSGAQYALMSSASIDNYGDLSLQVILIDLAAYQVMASEATTMNNKLDAIHTGCEALVKKIIVHLPAPQEPIVESETESTQLSTTTAESKQQGKAKDHRTYSIPSEPQQLTNLEADKVSRHLNRADVCIEMNYIDNAIKEYNEIVNIVPGWANVYMYLGDTYTLKGDDASLKLAIECYDIFMQLTDDQTLYYEAQDKLSRVEMMTELRGKEAKNMEDLIGTWKTDLYDKYSGKPYFVLDITKTIESNKYQITVSPKSLMYDNIVNAKAYAEIVEGKICFSYTFQETYIPKQSKYNMAGVVVNSLFHNNQLAAAIGNVVVESFREEDVGYTNIMDFDFITEIEIKDDLNKNAYMNGICHFKGEHHQAGRNKVDLDTIYNCTLLKGDERNPVLFKIERKGLRYQYDDMIIKNNVNELAKILRMGGYVDAELDRIKEINRITKKLGLVFGTVGLSSMIAGGGMLAADLNSDAPIIILCGGAVVAAIGFDIWYGGLLYKNSNIIKLISKHNQKVDQNLKASKTNREVSMAITPTGIGLQLSF